MTSFKQFEANRRNAHKSTGPRSEQGKQRSSRNAVRHGLSAETVIEPVEDAEDYRAFEEAVTADYEPVSAVERELILRLASLLWRLRRATSIETGLFQINGAFPLGRGQPRHARTNSKTAAVMAVIQLREPAAAIPAPAVPRDRASERHVDNDLVPDTRANLATPIPDKLIIARCFLHLAQLDNGAFERLGRSEAALWRQVRQTLFTLEGLRNRLRAPSRQHPWWRDHDVAPDRLGQPQLGRDT